MKKALVIGINEYPTHPLKGAVNDAQSISKLLKVKGNDDKHFQVNFHSDIGTRGELMRLIVDFFNPEIAADIGLLYFSGHGYVNELGGFIVTPDHEDYNEGIEMNTILGLANKSKIRNKVIVLDCCKSGVFGNQPEIGGITPIATGTTILTSSRKDEPSKEVNGHGVFTNLLIEGLKGGAADVRGHISPGGLYAYIDQALGAHEQRPVFKTNVTEFVELRSVIPQVHIGIIRKIIEYFDEPSKEFQLDPSFEDTNTYDIEHKVVEPFADKSNVSIFKNLQKLEGVGLVVPVDEEHMYYAAMNSKTCRLTALGHHYWRLVREGII